ncbi:uncharacterized protein LOC117792301 isoform X2 [Drosophila innubila]|uniref:uncharacterized protein LOC117792301 isoform X2 n=1 Tax=Drosophila innubila TaxID=198719 RepID=UPI00148C16E1|nr:uncharacterized protein LOC117792301 isoform X2 [Drosophila innubila]
MFKVDLKALLQLSKSTERTLRLHKRIQGKGKVRYIVCYEIKEGILTIQRMRRFRIGRSTRSKRRHSQGRSSRLSSVMSQATVLEISLPSPRVMDVGSQTLSVERNHARVDTVDLSLKISRLQQTILKSQSSTGSQTKLHMMEERSTQMDFKYKARWTQTNPEKCVTRVSSTQTVEKVSYEHSCTQTTMSEDQEEPLSQHLKLLHLLLRSSCSQGQLLFRGVESINQLIEFKQLELHKQRLMDTAEAQKVTQKEAQKEVQKEALKEVQKEALKEAHIEAAAKAKKLTEVKQLYSKRARLRCKHRCCLHMQRNKAKLASTKLDTETQTEILFTPTSCKWTQTKVAANLVAATQTDRDKDRDKGFLWLRRSN